MKTKIKSLITVCVIGCAGLFSACSKSSDKPKVSPVMNISISPEVAQNTSNFAFNFFNALQQTQPDTATIFVSPLSLHMDLGMLLNGAAGNTYTQLQNAMALNGLSIDEINQAYQTLLQDLPKADAQVQLTLANSMWYLNNFQVEVSYSNTLKNYFQADICPSSFGQATADSINQWAYKNTNGKINLKLTQRDIEEEIMMLLNALYFKGDWAS
jgi:serpin B